MSGKRLESLESKVSIFGKIVDGQENLDKLRTIPIDRITKEPMINVLIKSTIVIDDPFPEEEHNFEEPKSPQLQRVNL
jgi:peptidyl-prolyl cis-trans isomerase-like 4